jgi:hypothetical protein
MPSIVGKRQPVTDDKDAHVQLDTTQAELSGLSDWLKGEEGGQMPQWLDSMDGNHNMPAWLRPLSNTPGGKERIENVHGALMELERD